MVPQITHVPADRDIKEISVKRVSKAPGGGTCSVGQGQERGREAEAH